MNTFLRSTEFDAWLFELADLKAKARILARLNSAMLGNFGDCEPVGEGVSEMRVHVGAGYRVYFVRVGSTIYLLLCGGDKSSQRRDIARAKKLARGAQGDESMTTDFARFDISEYLDDERLIAEYLSAAMEDPNPDVFLAALGDVAKARGMAQIAKETGLGRESLYKALTSGAHPHYDTIKAVLSALGVKLSVVPQVSQG